MSNVSQHFRRLIGIFLIGIFAFGITPVVFLHALIANHKDISYNNSFSKETQVSKAGINCHCVSFVAEAPFLPSLAVFDLKAPLLLPLLQNCLSKTNFFSQHHFFAELRGPPYCA